MPKVIVQEQHERYGTRRGESQADPFGILRPSSMLGPRLLPAPLMLSEPANACAAPPTLLAVFPALFLESNGRIPRVSAVGRTKRT